MSGPHSIAGVVLACLPALVAYGLVLAVAAFLVLGFLAGIGSVGCSKKATVAACLGAQGESCPSEQKQSGRRKRKNAEVFERQIPGGAEDFPCVEESGSSPTQHEGLDELREAKERVEIEHEQAGQIEESEAESCKSAKSTADSCEAAEVIAEIANDSSFDVFLEREDCSEPWGFAWQAAASATGRLLITRFDRRSPAGRWSAKRSHLELRALERGDEVIAANGAIGYLGMQRELAAIGSRLELRILYTPPNAQKPQRSLASKTNRVSRTGVAPEVQSGAFRDCIVKNTFVEFVPEDWEPEDEEGCFAQTAPSSMFFQSDRSPTCTELVLAEETAQIPLDSVPPLPSSPAPAPVELPVAAAAGSVVSDVVVEQRPVSHTDSGMQIQVGQRIQIVDLVNAPQFNGRWGCVEAFNPALQRYAVRVEDSGCQIGPKSVRAMLRRCNLALSLFPVENAPILRKYSVNATNSLSQSRVLLATQPPQSPDLPLPTTAGKLVVAPLATILRQHAPQESASSTGVWIPPVTTGSAADFEDSFSYEDFQQQAQVPPSSLGPAADFEDSLLCDDQVCRESKLSAIASASDFEDSPGFCDSERVESVPVALALLPEVDMAQKAEPCQSAEQDLTDTICSESEEVGSSAPSMPSTPLCSLSALALSATSPKGEDDAGTFGVVDVKGSLYSRHHRSTALPQEVLGRRRDHGSAGNAAEAAPVPDAEITQASKEEHGYMASAVLDEALVAESAEVEEREFAEARPESEQEACEKEALGSKEEGLPQEKSDQDAAPAGSVQPRFTQRKPALRQRPVGGARPVGAGAPRAHLPRTGGPPIGTWPYRGGKPIGAAPGRSRPRGD